MVQTGTLTLVTSDLDYGFVLPLEILPELPHKSPEQSSKNVSLEQLRPDLLNTNLPPELRAFILNYQVPQDLQQLQVDRRRFLTGKVAAFPALPHPVSTEVPLVLNQTYLLRSFQFQIPPVLESGRFTVTGDQRYRDTLLGLAGSDLLISLRPIERRSDGSYRVVWRILKAFPALSLPL
jgi:hypothetical protein